MKVLIYAGLGLFSMASVYGIADYYLARKNGSIDNLYKEKKMVAQPVGIPVNNPTPITNDEMILNADVPDENKDIKTVGSALEKKKTIRLESFSRAIINEMPDLRIDTTVSETRKRPAAKTKPALKTTSKKADRKLNLKMFSRAPLERPVRTVKNQ